MVTAGAGGGGRHRWPRGRPPAPRAHARPLKNGVRPRFCTATRRGWGDVAPAPVVCGVLVGGVDQAEEAVGLVVDPGAEQQRVAVARHAVSEPQAPEAVDLDSVAVRTAKLAEPLAGADVVGV